MRNSKLLLLAAPVLAISALGALTGCGKKYDVKLTVYNWEDYIYEGTDDSGKIVADSTVKAFEKFYTEKTGKSIKVNYETFSTNEEMYQQIKLEAISPDLICPSDYMIQKMANENMLEELSYNESTKKFGDSLSNWDQYGSPFIKNRFAAEKLNNGKSFLSYSIPYFWGTMGFTYDYDWFEEKGLLDEINSWECLWSTNSLLKKQFSLKDSVRDTYVVAIFHVYKDDIAALNPADPDYNQKLSAIFNKCDDTTISKVEQALTEAKNRTVYGLEVDDGKDAIVQGTYRANLAWSGDSVYSMKEADKAGKNLHYSLPEEGSNVWFDGWCMPKGANKEVAEEFLNFICTPKVAADCMKAVGYTSPIVGQEIWDMINEWYAADEGEESYKANLDFYFGDTIDGKAEIFVPVEEAGRQFDAQYPTEDVLKRCCMMKDFGAQQDKVDQMWQRIGIK